jgi:outer membrane protein assembly factor BamD
MNALEQNDYFFSAQKFLESEMLFPQSEWAPKSLIMASYSYYMLDYYSLAIENLKRYFDIYSNDKNEIYARYLMALCYFELIEGEKRDTAAIFLAKEQFQIVINSSPNSEYALDSQFKLNLINDLLAAKEIYLGRYYLNKNKWIPAMNRFKTVLDDYDTTVYVEEAIHRLVEINYKIGLKEEAKKYATLLGYNYQSSDWYKETYKIFNSDYSLVLKKDQKSKNSILDKFKNLLN